MKKRLVTIGMVLKFFTGEEEVPILGFHVKPMTEFVPADKYPSMIPTASTCSYQLFLPRFVTADQEKEINKTEYYQQMDSAFLNDFFGKV